MKDSATYEWVFSTALVWTAYSFVLSGGMLVALMLSQGAVVILSLLAFLHPKYRNIKRSSIIVVMMFSSSLLINILVNNGNYSDSPVSYDFAIMHVLGVIGILFSLAWSSANLSFEGLLKKIVVLLTPLVLVAIGESIVSGRGLVRHSPFGMHPNWWGELGFVLVVSTLSYRGWRRKLVPLVASFTLFLLVQSRGSLVAALGAVCVYFFLSTRRNEWFRGLSLITMLAVGILVLGAVYIFQNQFDQLLDLILDRVLLWNDPYRGIGTGLTGRTDGWIEAIGVFLEQPIFGHGIDTLSEVHNGFLRLVGEGGVLLVLFFTGLVAVGLKENLDRRNYLAVSIVAGYFIYFMTYPRMLNMNLAAIVFYMSLFPYVRSNGVYRASTSTDSEFC